MPWLGMATLRIGTQDSPNACVTMGIPLGIFEHVSAFLMDIRHSWLNVERARQDILPEHLEKREYGQCAIRSDGVV